MPNPARYMDDAAEAIRRLMTKGGVVLPPPGAARAAGDAVIDPAVAARAARQMEPDFSNVQVLPDNALPLSDPSVAAQLDNAAQGGPDMSLGTPLFDQMYKSHGAYDNLRAGRTVNLRNQPFARAAQDAIQEANARSAKMRAAMEASAARGEVMQDVGMMAGGAAAAGAMGAGAYALTRAGLGAGQKTAPPKPAPQKAAAPAKSSDDPLFADKQPLTSTGGTAELANESRPVPAVPTSTSPRDQAQELIAKLNAGHRAGTITPSQDQQMRTEIDRLLALSNTQRNAMTPQQAKGSDDPHIQAQALIAQLNEMRAARPGGGEVPQAQQIMAEVRRLQALGDQRRNAAQTR